MSAILAIDQGTTSSRAIVYDVDGRELGRAQREVPVHVPRPGWAEQDAGVLLAATLACARAALAAAGIAAGELAACGIANQRETTVIWDRGDGRPVAPAIVWQDRRTADFTDALRDAGHEATIAARTGLCCDPYFSASKIRHLLREHRLARRAADGELAFGTVDAWLIWHLTGGRHLTDASNASRTCLFDIDRLEWDDGLCELFEVPAPLLPAVLPSSGDFGATAADALGAAIPIRGVAGDQQAALFGQACSAPGSAKGTYGTGGFVMRQCGEDRAAADGCLGTVAWQLAGEAPRYALEGTVFVSGAAVQWLRDGLDLIADAAEIERLAESVDDAGGVRFVPALTGLATPHWDPRAAGLIVGIGRDTTKAHLARATLEAMAHQVADALAAMDAGTEPTAELRVDGGAAGNDLLCQIQADLLGIPVVRPVDLESTARGAANLAAVGAGLADEETLARRWKAERTFAPQRDAAWRTRERGEWERAVERSLAWR